jgi:type II secretory pathway pseudopilin PulG
MRTKRTNQKGFALLIELLIVMAVTATLVTMAGVSFVQIRAAENQTQAVLRLRQVATAQAALAICNATPGCIPSVGLSNVVPPAGPIRQSSFIFDFETNGGFWFMTATPVSAFGGTRAYFVDYTGIVRFNESGPATATSPVWNF